MSRNTVSIWWNKWIKAGIAEPISVKGGGIRAKRVFSLDDFGIEVPTVRVAASETRKNGAKEA